MPTHYRPVPLHPIDAGTPYDRPGPPTTGKIDKDSPALQVMTDLRKVVAVTTGPDVNIDTANQQMMSSEVRLLLVTNERGQVIGLITANDILGERPMKHLQRTGGKHADILVRHIMTPRERLEALDIKDVAHARVGDIVTTLTNVGRQHALAISIIPGGEQSICGIFSSTQIGRQLEESIEISDKAKTFAEIEAALSTDRTFNALS